MKLMPRKLIPMLFSDDMARANMNGCKTVTRRTRGLDVVNADPGKWVRGTRWLQKDGPAMFTMFGPEHKKSGIGLPCPYGRPGDVMWQREGWAKPMPLQLPYIGEYMYRGDTDLSIGVKWQPSIYMPLEACRFFAVITELELERVQDISEQEAIAEGCPYGAVGREPDFAVGNYHFPTLWANINGPGSWDANPYVWVVRYRQLSRTELMEMLPELLMNQPVEKQKRIRRVVLAYYQQGKEAAV